MQSARRFVTHRVVAVAALAAVGLLGLAACRTSPSVAAYVKGEAITEKEVDAIVADAQRLADDANRERAEREGRPLTDEETMLVPSRRDVVMTLVLERVCAAARSERGFTDRPVRADRIAFETRTSIDSRYVQERVKLQSCLEGVPISEQPPTDAELDDFMDRLAASAFADPTLTRDVLRNHPQVRSSLAYSRELTAMVQAADVSINPRYRPVEYIVAYSRDGIPLVVTLVGEAGSDAVRDLS